MGTTTTRVELAVSNNLPSETHSEQTYQPEHHTGCRSVGSLYLSPVQCDVNLRDEMGAQSRERLFSCDGEHCNHELPLVTCSLATEPVAPRLAYCSGFGVGGPDKLENDLHAFKSIQVGRVVDTKFSWFSF